MKPEAVAGRFLFDLGHPDCYLTAERILGELPVIAEWEPVYGAQIGIELGTRDRDLDRLTQAAHAQGLLPLRLPEAWPPDSELAMRAATFARGGGRTVAFSLAAFRQAFAGGRDLADQATVLIAAAASEMHPRSVITGVAMRSVARSLREAGERAQADGVTRLPAIVYGDRVFQGPDALSTAVAALAPPAR
jgi:2-hydroxychromene-2-carboxylate isomerase